MMTFRQWGESSEDVAAIRGLLARDDIWEPQRRDGDDKSSAETADFGTGTYCAVFRGDDMHGMPYGPIGYVLFMRYRDGGVYNQHTAFITEARGPVALRMTELAIAELFTTTDAMNLISFCPHWHKAAGNIARTLGGRLLYTVDHFARRDGECRGADVYGMTILEWAYKAHGAYAEIGHRWHEQVFAKLKPHHDDDAAHDGFLGLALKVGERRPMVGIELYNAWAHIAGYAKARMLWADGQGHSLIDIQEAVVVNLPNGEVGTIIPKCQQSQPSEPS